MIENLKLINGEISIVKILIILYLIVFTNTLTVKFGEKLLYKINENIILKHIIGLITIGIILSLLYSLEGKDLILYSLLIYFAFLLSTKMSSDLLIIAIVILAGLYFFDYFNDKKINQLNNDNNVSKEIKNNIITNKKNNKRNITLMTLFVVVCGSLIYENKKVGQYGGSFNLDKFLN